MGPIVQTQYGALRGIAREGSLEFLGVPYAQPPIGPLRFRRPLPPIPWEDVREAAACGDYCPQPGQPDSMDKTAGPSEDCLTLNIYTPACDEKKRPVTVWIHGGAYMTGCASEPTRHGGILCRRGDMVVVAIQYRLGAFGQVDFSCFSDRFDANCGTWDQVAAVEWVVDNIRLFGGDPENITLMGESAGAASVLTLITLPRLRGKIKGAVMESTPPFLIHTRENGKRAAQEVLKRLEIPEAEAYKVADLPTEKLVQAVREAEEAYPGIQPYLIPTGPVVDGDLIPELPMDTVLGGKVQGMRILIGTTRDEGTMFARGKPGDIFPTSSDQLDVFWNAHPELDRERIIAYCNRGKGLFPELGKEVVFHMPTVRLIRALSRENRVFAYRFDYTFPVLRLLGLGAIHCTNSVMTFGGTQTGLMKSLSLFSGATGRRLSAQVHESWCRFLATGDPNCPRLPQWPDWSQGEKLMIFRRRCRTESEDLRETDALFGSLRPYGN